MLNHYLVSSRNKQKYNKKINTTDGILSTHKVFYSVASAKHIPVSFRFVQ